MIFTEFRFLFFFGLVFAVHWALPRPRLRKLWLLGASYTFYAAWDWRFLNLIILSTVVDYCIGLSLHRTQSESHRRGLLTLSLGVNLGLLGFFKYYNFFIESAADFATLLGLPFALSHLNIILPVGISFYTFQTLSYTLDLYRRELQPTTDFFDFALFVGFFPQLVAGPIVRARDFLPLLSQTPSFAQVAVRSHIALFLIGFFKKACLADNVAPMVDLYFADPSSWDATSSWIAASLYAAQIYCDFSGYSDMAIATAGLLGYPLRLNFAHPYFSSNITEFWRRWHISLSSWLRDYLYIPLGGNRSGRAMMYRNLMITMILGGLWHGASWNFVIWGFLHGLALAAHKVFTTHLEIPWRSSRTWHSLGWFFTYWWVCLCWIFFRAPTLADALIIVKAYFFVGQGSQTLDIRYLILLLVALIAHWIAYRIDGSRWLHRMPSWAITVIFGLSFALIYSLARVGYAPFIYFQF